jgi:hypothetical protein
MPPTSYPGAPKPTMYPYLARCRQLTFQLCCIRQTLTMGQACELPALLCESTYSPTARLCLGSRMGGHGWAWHAGQDRAAHAQYRGPAGKCGVSLSAGYGVMDATQMTKCSLCTHSRFLRAGTTRSGP